MNANKKESRIKRLMQTVIKINKFITHDVWSTRVDDLPPKLRLPFKYLRVILLALRGFNEDKVQIKASALTYYSLMSIVPVFAMIFGIAKGFGFDKYLEQQIVSSFKGQEEVMNQVISFSNSLLARTGGGIIAGIGIVLLFWSVMKVLTNIENSFNDIWQIEKPRTFTRKFTDYLSIMLIAPVLLIASSSINIFLTTQISSIAQEFELFGYVSPLLIFALQFLPYLLIWVLFSFIFIAMPNTKVSYASGIIAGIIAGSGFLIVQWGYVFLQVGVSKYNAIYGSFAALPLFLIWLQTSWLIVLFGAEISFAYQNVEMYEFEKETNHISHSNKKTLSILILTTIIKRFKAGETPLTSLDLSLMLHIPQRLMRNLLDAMIECNLINEVVQQESKDIAYQPARHINQFTLAYVEEKLDNHGLSIDSSLPELEHVKQTCDKFTEEYREMTKSTILGDI
ncbi:MAG: YihY/virulence factor BrkB family protein [Bacteroidales bacterium]|nr:YihY/virulence factor BrkB family protein [Bacteroidales bacterium]